MLSYNFLAWKIRVGKMALIFSFVFNDDTIVELVQNKRPTNYPIALKHTNNNFTRPSWHSPNYCGHALTLFPQIGHWSADNLVKFV